MKVTADEVIFLAIFPADHCVLMGRAHNPFGPTATNFKETHKTITKLQELKCKPHKQKHSSSTMLLMAAAFLRCFLPPEPL